MLEILQEYGLELFFGLVSAGLLALLKTAYTQKNNQKKEYEALLKEDQVRQQRKMIVDEIEPLVEEIHRVKKHGDDEILKLQQYIKEDEKEFEKQLKGIKDFHNYNKEEFDEKIDELAKKHQENLNRIMESYKFRFIQLCKTHLKDNYITQDEFEQIVTFYDLYHGLGGNGQAEEYYEKVKKLEIKEKPEE